MAIHSRSWQSEGYRFGFNGKEDDNDVGDIQDYGFRIYNKAIARFLSVDPLAPDYPWYTPYQFAGNRPIIAIDLDGLEEYIVTNTSNVPHSKTQLSNLDTRMLINMHTAQDGNRKGLRAIRRVARRLNRAGGDWSKVKLKRAIDFNAAFDLAVNLPVMQYLNKHSSNIDVQQIMANQEVIDQKFKDSDIFNDYEKPKQAGLRNFPITHSPLNFPASDNGVALVGTGSLRTIFSNDIIRYGLGMAGFEDPRRNPPISLETGATINTDSPGTLTYTGFSSSIVGMMKINPVSQSFNVPDPEGGTITLRNPPYLGLNRKLPDAGFDLEHSNRNAKLGLTINVTVWTAIQINDHRDKPPSGKKKDSNIR
ncbi:MAG: hypothetical protein JJT94_01375 [Bernardetiaceae bacterium]|nr:hypothetical protein [Bernardetiaceae bacterium]